MPFIPHTAQDIQAMLDEIGVADLDELFDEIPASLRRAQFSRSSESLNEMEVLRWMEDRAAQDAGLVCFAGAGCYDHHVPAAVWDLASRGEFMTAYTPYQAEASQGVLQVIFEYQSMMCALTGLDASNASVYDGASGLAEAVLMAVRALGRRNPSRRILMAGAVHPHYRAVAHNITVNQGIGIEALPMKEGLVDLDALPDAGEFAALVVQQPNFFGGIEDVATLTDWAHARGALVIGVVNPLTLAVLQPPGAWGAAGADIACGDGQPLGAPMASGGPSFGFICTKMKHVRQLPGRLVGQTEDREGKPGYALTLQAREQHIRRGKATSNICTNQGLLVTAAAIHMAILGAQGLAEAACASRANTLALVRRLTAVQGVRQTFPGPFFHECALTLPRPAQPVLDALAEKGILGGVALGQFRSSGRSRAGGAMDVSATPDVPEGAPDGADDGMSTNDLLVCATEKRTEADIDAYARALAEVLA